MGYPSDILSTRAVIRPGKYVVIPPEGLVNNVIPGIENCRVSIVALSEVRRQFCTVSDHCPARRRHQPSLRTGGGH